MEGFAVTRVEKIAAPVPKDWAIRSKCFGTLAQPDKSPLKYVYTLMYIYLGR